MNADRSKQFWAGQWWVFLQDASGWRFAPLGLNGTIDIGTPRLTQYRWIRDKKLNIDTDIIETRPTCWLERALCTPGLKRPRLYKSV